MSIQECFEYIQKYNLSNNFTISIQDQFKKYGSLSEKQRESIINIVSKHRLIQSLLSKKKDSPIFLSIKQFFDTHNFLTNKQIELLKKIC